MKKIIILYIIFLCGLTQAQIGIEKTNFRSPNSIIEFNDMEENGGVAKGIILPILKDASSAKEGALWVESKTMRVLYKSKKFGEVALTDSYMNSLPKPSYNEIGKGVIISDSSSPNFTDDPAVLKLESNNKALLLPHVNDVTTDISNPEPGTIAYDVKSKSLAIFNGDKWFFWN